jgi:hypothetical protein
MSFGFSIGDFVQLTQLAWSVVQNTRKAVGAHGDLLREVTSLHLVLSRLSLEVQNPASLLNQTHDGRRDELLLLRRHCARRLRVLAQILDKYNALDDEKRKATKFTKFCHRVRFGNGEMQDLGEIRGEIAAYTSALTLFLNLISMGSHGRVESLMEKQGGELSKMRQSLNWLVAEEQARSRPNGEGSILTSYAEDDTKVWKEFRRGLIEEGFKSGVIERHGKIIKEYIMELGTRGALDDVLLDGNEATPMAPHTAFAEEEENSGDGSGEESEEEGRETTKEGEEFEDALSEEERTISLENEEADSEEGASEHSELDEQQSEERREETGVVTDDEGCVQRSPGSEGERDYESGGGDPVGARRSRFRVGKVVVGSLPVRRAISPAKMTSRSHTTLPSMRNTTTSRRRRNHRPLSPERKSSRRRKSAPKEETTYVYGAPEGKKRPSRIVVVETRLRGRDRESTEQEEERATQSDSVIGKGKVKKVVYVSGDGKVGVEYAPAGEGRVFRIKSAAQGRENRQRDTGPYMRSRARPLRNRVPTELSTIDPSAKNGLRS